MWLLFSNYRRMRSRFFVLFVSILMLFSFRAEPLFASVGAAGLSFRNGSIGGEKRCLFGLFDTSNLIEQSPFIKERGHYVYRGGELKGSYDLQAPLYIENDLVVQCQIRADEIIVNSRVEIKRTKAEKNAYKSNCGLIARNDFKINKKGSLSMERGTFIDVGRNFKSKTEQSFLLDNGCIVVRGNVSIQKKWNSNNNCIIKIIGKDKHVLKGDTSASVGILSITEDALYNVRISKSLFGKKPRMFQVKDLAIKFSDSMVVKDFSPEIDRYLSCKPYQSAPPGYITNFAKNYLYQILYCSGDRYSVDIYDTFFHAKSDGPQADFVALKNEKAFYLDNTKKLHSVSLDITYTGVRNNKSTYSEGFGTLKITDDGGYYEFIFCPRLDDSDIVMDDFVSSLRKGASEVIKDQAKEIVLSQVISDVTDICAPNMFDFEVGTGLCKNIEVAKFFEDFDNYYKNWNQMKNGLVLGPNDKTEYAASEEHVNAPNEYQEDTSELSNDQSTTDSADNNPNTKVYELLVDKANNLKKEYGLMEENGTSPVYVDSDDYYSNRVSIDKEAYGEGILLLDIFDYDNDNVLELLSIRRRTGSVDVNQGDRIITSDHSEYLFEIYEVIEDECQLADSIVVGVFDILDWSINYSNMSVFRHETDEYSEICIETYICQQDHPDDTSLVIIRYDGDMFSIVDGIRFGYWFHENGVLCMKPSSEKAIDYLSYMFPSSYTFWDPIISVNSFEDNQFVSTRNEILKNMGFKLIQTRLDVEQGYNKSEMSSDEYQDMYKEINSIKAADCYKPIEGSITTMAFLSEDTSDGSHNNSNQVGIIHNINTYVGEKDINKPQNNYSEDSDDKTQIDDEYIIPDSDKRLLTEDDINELDEEMLKLARNEIYARHGRLFNDESIQRYFNTKSWYKGKITPEKFQQESLSEIEQTNAEYILKYEKNKKNDEVFDYVISHLHGLWYSCSMTTDGPIAKMVCEGNDFNGEIYEIVEYHDGYLVRISEGYSYYFGKDLSSCSFVDGWETTADNTSGANGWWKPNEEQRKQYED